MSLKDQSKFAEAEPLFRQSLEARAKLLGPGHHRVAIVKVELGEALVGLKRYAEAEPLLVEAQEVLSADATAAQSWKRTSVELLARLYVEWNGLEPQARKVELAERWGNRLREMPPPSQK